MALIINLESSTEVCSVSLSENGELTDYIEDTNGQNHSRLLSVFVDSLMNRNKLTFSDIDAVAVSKGPGSYTGLRIGVSLAKGICYGSNLPLIAISPLEAMASYVRKNLSDFGLNDLKNPLFCPMIDARRMEVYTAIYNQQGEEINPVSTEIIDEHHFSSLLKDHQLIFFGNGAKKCREKVSSPNAYFIDDLKTSAQFMCPLAEKAFENNDLADLAYFEPFYLKDFIAGIPKKNILNR